MDQILKNDRIFGQWPGPEMYNDRRLHMGDFNLVLELLGAFYPVINAKKDDFWGKNQSSDLQQALNCRWLSTNNAYSMTFKLGPQAMMRGSLTGLQEAWKWGQNCRKMTIFGGKSII